MNSLAYWCGRGSVEPCQSYVYMGNPLLHLVIPAVAPPSGLQATPGNARVSLSWNPSALPGALYDVYGSTGLVPPDYQKLTGSPQTETTFEHAPADNMQTYYYFVVALDAEGFESRWSNFNSDCAVDGPDCVKATPSNPNPPPPPQGVTVVDPETGGNLRVSWSSAGAPDNLKNYTVVWGTAPGVYTQSVNAVNKTAYQLSGLTNGVRYYIAVTATNTSNRTSGFSTEVSCVPTFVLGVRSPAFITSLRLSKSGTSAVLTWDPVTMDIYGKPETIASYEIFRGETPGFLPSLSNRIGTSTSPTFTDSGALATAAPYHYLVRAVDVDGNVGGLGNQLPSGILTLRVNRGSPSSTVVLSWTAVGTDFDGRPTTVVSYNVYVSSQPFSRDAIRAGTVGVFQNVSGTSLELPNPPPGNQYYSVLAVDRRGNLSSF